MSSSSFEFDFDSSSSSDNSFSMTKELLSEPIEDDESYSKMTHNVVQATAIHVPMIVSTTLIGNKRPYGGSTSSRRYIHRDRKERHDLIINDYFKGENSKYTSEHFRRRFRMDVELFKRILQAIKNYDDYFTQKVDAAGRVGLSPLQKMIAAVRMLAYGCPADLLDEYVQIGESTAIESLKRFCDAIIGVFKEQYLRKPNKDDVARLLKEGEDRGFPGHRYNMGYYLSDGIYPQYATLIQTVSEPSSIREKLFARYQGAVRKDVERAFGVLQSRWNIVKGPARMWNVRDLGKIMKTCIILHNMIIKSEHGQGINPESWQPHGDERVEDVHLEHDYTFLVSTMINRMRQVQDKRVKLKLSDNNSYISCGDMSLVNSGVHV
ncbi:hypothetical protein FEM48_Zijuj06G0173200 [Ziziphus jujuba var. spinosa]|uniref:Nuclease HARBI1 n=1 Tax=Ziziphus jujuba var. spinosa TaxID=714518 RepID=A0A978VAL2_ZIZJJ|nr:hypothetical protein FEM48_Zijuj06G0173200 [Ziziphus jujuba var. spinosa]